MTKPSFRASEADRVFACPGSPTLIQALKLPADSEEGHAITHAGNWCHWEAARRLVAEHGAIATNGLPKTAQGVPADFKPSHFDRRCVEYYLRTLLDYIGPDMAIEVEAELIYDIGPCLLTGHDDAFAISPDAKRGIGSDFKRGHIVVDPAERNWQMCCYAALRKLAYPQLEHYTQLLIQPAIVETDGVERVTAFVIEGAELEALPAFLAGRFASAIANDRELETGWRQCRYCPGADQSIHHPPCPALLEAIEHMKHTLTDEELSRASTGNDADTLAKFYLARKLIDPLGDKAGRILKEIVVSKGGTLDTSEARFGTAPWSGKRKLQSDKGYDRLCDLFPEEAERVYRCIELSATAIEEEIADAFKLPLKSSKKDAPDAKKAFAERFGDITEQAKTVALRVIG